MDGSELAEKALKQAIEFAKSEGSSLLLVRVVSLAAISTEYNTMAVIDTLNRMQDTAKLYLNTIVDSLRGERLDVQGKVLVGDPATRVVEFAEEREVDLIVLSSRGRTGLAKWYFGSVAESIRRHSSRPTLVLPRQSRGGFWPAAEIPKEPTPAALIDLRCSNSQASPSFS